MESAQFGAQIEHHVIGQRDAHQHVGHGQRQHEPIGDDHPQPPTQADGEYGERIAEENYDHQARIETGPQGFVVGYFGGALIIRAYGDQVVGRPIVLLQDVEQMVCHGDGGNWVGLVREKGAHIGCLSVTVFGGWFLHGVGGEFYLWLT